MPTKTRRFHKDAVVQRRTNKEEEGTGRKILILDPEKAKPNSEAWHFLKRQSRNCDKMCIELIEQPPEKRKIIFSEELCAVCLARAKQCPGGAVKIVRLPSALSSDVTHRYGPNAFRLHGLPMPRPQQVLGLLGENGIGKSTAIDILAGKLKPNLGLDSWSPNTKTPAWSDIIRYYRGCDLQNYFTRLVEGRLRCVIKPQMEAAKIVRYLGGNKTVGEVLRDRNERGNLDEMVEKLQLSHLLERQIRNLSGGELQRLVICAVLIRDADVYLFDEPSSFLDVKQRILVADMIRGLVDPDLQSLQTLADLKAARQLASSKYVILVEHDLTMLDYTSDYVCCLYGDQGAYGVAAKRSKASRGINQFLAGYLVSENVRFRAEELTFKVSMREMLVDEKSSTESRTQEAKSTVGKESLTDCPRIEYTYPAMTKTYRSDDARSFTLHVEAGGFRDGEVVGIMGQNGSGKTSFMNMMADHLESTAQNQIVEDDGGSSVSSSFGVSHKKPNLGSRFAKFKGTVQQFLEMHIQGRLGDRMFRLLVLKPLSMDKMENLPVRSLSGGELQRLAICVCLGTPAFVYLLDEPSAGLDCEQRMNVSKVIKRWVVSYLGRAAFVIEHDLLMASSMNDRVILIQGEPGIECTVKRAAAPKQGLNDFLRELRVTVRLDPMNHRLRINKRGCRRDREQKATGKFFSMESADDD